MDRMEKKIEKAHESRVRLKERLELQGTPQDSYKISALALEQNLSAEHWKERTLLMEYDPIDFKPIRAERNLTPEDRKIAQSIQNSLHELLTFNKSAHIKADQITFIHSGAEQNDTSQNVIGVLLGQVGRQFCVVGDSDSKIIMTPLFDSLLAVHDDYIDVAIHQERIRFSRGTYSLIPERKKNLRKRTLSTASNLPQSFDKFFSVRVSILEPDQQYVALPAEIETIDNDSVPEYYPANEAHASFASIQKNIFDYIGGQKPSEKTASTLKDVESALHLPYATIDDQLYTITLRTSEDADIIFFHNVTLQSEQDQVADAMSHLSIDEFLELATDDARRNRLMSETLVESGFYFVRQHNGRVFLMDRHIRDVIITPDTPYFMDILNKAEDKLAEYFAALDDLAPEATSLRSTRIELAEKMTNQIETDKRNDTVWKKIGRFLLS